MSDDAIYLHLFNTIHLLGAQRLLKICRHFASTKEAFSSSPKQLIAAGLEHDMAQKIASARDRLPDTAIEHEQEKLTSLGINLFAITDPLYPTLLTEISQPPPLLYYRGAFTLPDELCIAVVGTRKITNYGRTVVPFLIEPLLPTGITVVSGLALGVDSLAQQLAVKNNKRTIAILGSGVDEASIYPKQHTLLADEIVQTGGCLMSEYPPGTPAFKHHFIARNRIISGLCAATIVIECDLKSGSLITAKYALEQNRTVFAVPGPIYATQSNGPNNLIKMGAKLITEATDILQDLNIPMATATELSEPIGDTPTETALLKLLSFEPITTDELIAASKIDPGEVISTLTFLEIKGKVRNLGAQQYIRGK